MKYIIDIPNDSINKYVSLCDRESFVVPITVGLDNSICFNTGLKLKPYTEPDTSDRKAIEDEVWDFVTTCTKMDGADSVDVFGGFSLDSFAKYSYQEAKSRYEAWKKQKDEIRVGDEVEYPPNKAKGIVVQCHVPDVYAEVDKYAVFTGTSVEYLTKEWLTKTGRVFPEVAELLKKMEEA